MKNWVLLFKEGSGSWGCSETHVPLSAVIVKAWWKISMRFTNYTKYRRFQMQTCCVYMLKTLRFYEWFSLKSDAELLLMFLNIKTKNQRFSVHPKAEAERTWPSGWNSIILLFPYDFIFSTFELQTRLLPNAVILLVESVHLDQKNLKKSSLIRFVVVNLCFSESKITFLHTK